MPSESLTLTLAIGALDIVLIALALAGLLRDGLKRGRPLGTPEDTFAELESALWASFPSLPPGFTFREAFSFLKRSGFDLDWKEIESSLQAHEYAKFGGGPAVAAGTGEVRRLVSKVKRHGLLGRD